MLFDFAEFFFRTEWIRKTILLHRHAFGEIPRLVDVAAEEIRGVVGEKLSGDGGEKRIEISVGFREDDVPVGEIDRLFGDGEDFPSSGLDFFDRGEIPLVVFVVRNEDDGRTVPVDERERSVLELSERKGFGVDVGDFLELERRLHGDREPGSSGEKECMRKGDEVGGDFPDLRREVEDFLSEQGKLFQLVEDVSINPIIGTFVDREVERKE